MCVQAGGLQVADQEMYYEASNSAFSENYAFLATAPHVFHASQQ